MAYNKEKRREKYLRLNERERDKVRRYGLTVNQFYALLKEQDNRCAICEEPLVKPCIDHCHETNKVRKILCNSCNVILGHAKEDASLLMKAIMYLHEYYTLKWR